jgi:hypothetical protein
MTRRCGQHIKNRAAGRRSDGRRQDNYFDLGSHRQILVDNLNFPTRLDVRYSS